MTKVTNIDNSCVIAVIDGRTEESLGSFLGAMDMWPAYINAIVVKAANELGESMNAKKMSVKIQKIKSQALQLSQSSTLPRCDNVPSRWT